MTTRRFHMFYLIYLYYILVIVRLNTTRFTLNVSIKSDLFKIGVNAPLGGQRRCAHPLRTPTAHTHCAHDAARQTYTQVDTWRARLLGDQVSRSFRHIVVVNMFVARSIAADHKDLIHDVSYDFHGRRMATCSSDQSVKVTWSNYTPVSCRS